MSPDPTSMPSLCDAVSAALERSSIAVEDIAVTSVYARPGAETSARVTAKTSAGTLDLVVTTAMLEASSQMVLARSAGVAYSMWLHPHDPCLPGLAHALDSQYVSEALGTRIESTELLAYRPMRRAVVRAVGDGISYLKVVRPDRASTILSAASALGQATVAVRDLGDGVLATDAAHGEPLISLIAQPSATAEAVNAVVSSALSALPASVAGLPRRPSWVSRRETYGRAAIARGMSAEHVELVLSAPLPQTDAVMATHGDFHLTNVRYALNQDGPYFASVIDVDTAGPGDQGDDLACMLAHIAALDALDPEMYQHTARLTDDLVELWADRAPLLRERAAAVLLSLATTHENRSIADAWLASAARFASGGAMREFSLVSPGALVRDNESFHTGPQGTATR